MITIRERPTGTLRCPHCLTDYPASERLDCDACNTPHCSECLCTCMASLLERMLECGEVTQCSGYVGMGEEERGLLLANWEFAWVAERWHVRSGATVYPHAVGYSYCVTYPIWGVTGRTVYDPHYYRDDTMPDLREWCEEQGYATEWSETHVVCECGLAFALQDYHGTQGYVGDGWVQCADCISENPADYLEDRLGAQVDDELIGGIDTDVWRECTLSGCYVSPKTLQDDLKTCGVDAYVYTARHGYVRTVYIKLDDIPEIIAALMEG